MDKTSHWNGLEDTRNQPDERKTHCKKPSHSERMAEGERERGTHTERTVEGETQGETEMKVYKINEVDDSNVA